MNAFLNDIAELELRLIHCQPVPSRWEKFATRKDLHWKGVPFGAGSRSKVPRTQGLYCFMVGPPAGNLPLVCYPMYLGRTSRTLRDRFGEYLLERNSPDGRPHVRKFLNVFDGELIFMCTEFDGTLDQLVATERALLDAMMPAYSRLGFTAVVHSGKGAWQ